MAHLSREERRERLCSCSTTGSSSETCKPNQDSSTRLCRRSVGTSSGLVFLHSFPWARKPRPVTREMKQRAGEILSDALPSNSSGEDSSSDSYITEPAISNSRKGKLRTRLRARYFHDDADSSSICSDTTSSYAPRPHDATAGRGCGRSGPRGPPVLSEIREKLQEAASHHVRTRRWRGSSSETHMRTKHHLASEHLGREDPVSAGSTYEVNHGTRSRRKIPGRMYRRLLLFKTVASPKGVAATEGRDHDLKLHLCGASAADHGTSVISSPSGFFEERCVELERPPRRRLRSHKTSLLVPSHSVLPDARGHVVPNTVDGSCQHQRQPQLQAISLPSGQRQLDRQQQVTYRPPPRQGRPRDTHQQRQESQRHLGYYSTSHTYSCEPAACGEATRKPEFLRSPASVSPDRKSVKSPSRVLVDIHIIRTIVHEAAALRIAWSLQTLLRKHVSHAIVLFRDTVSLAGPLRRGCPREGTSPLNCSCSEHTRQQAVDTTVPSARQACATEASSFHASAAKFYQPPERPSGRFCSNPRGEAALLPESGVQPGAWLQHTGKIRMAGTRLFVQQLRLLLVNPTMRLAWSRLNHVQKEPRDSRYVQRLYKSLKVTSRWVATFTRAAAAKIILRIAALALQRCTLRALLLMKTSAHSLQPTQRHPASCSSGRQVLSERPNFGTHWKPALSIEPECSRCATPPPVGEKSLTSTIRSSKPQHSATALLGPCAEDIRTTQSKGMPENSAERQRFEEEAGELACRMVDNGCVPPSTAEGTVCGANLHATAAETVASSCSRVNSDSTQSTETENRTRDRVRVSNVTDTPPSSGKNRKNNSTGSVHKVQYLVRTASCTNASVSDCLTQPRQPQSPEIRTGETVVVRRTPLTRSPQTHCHEGRTEAITGRSSSMSRVILHAAPKSFPSAPTALAIDEAAISPLPFAQGKLKVTSRAE